MGKMFIIGLVVLSMVAFGCIQANAPDEPPLVCNKPYILVGNSCCLDENDNSICDTDEEQEPEAEPTVTPKEEEPIIPEPEEEPEEQVKCEAPYIQVGTDCCLDADSNQICDKDEQVKTCPADLQVCPGGSSVGRDPDNSCNFYPCPEIFPEPEENESNETEEINLTACETSPVLSAITSNLMEKSNDCGSIRVNVLCGVCATCCSEPGVAKSEYLQSIDPDCYPCANSNFGVARARDYYGRMGTYEGICTENCPDLVSAYQAFLQYGEDYSCILPSGWMICDDVTLS